MGLSRGVLQMQKPPQTMRERIDLSSDPRSQPKDGLEGEASRRPFVGIHFTCCNAYLRVYPEVTGKVKILNCPRCARPLKVEFSEGRQASQFRQIS